MEMNYPIIWVFTIALCNLWDSLTVHHSLDIFSDYCLIVDYIDAAFLA